MRRLLALALLAAACSSGGSGNTDPTGTIHLTLSQSAGSVVQGGSLSLTGTLTRGGGFTGTVSFTVEGAPATVTAGVSNVQTSGTTTSATVTITALANAAPGTYTVTVRGTATGLTPTTASFTLTIQAAAPPAIALSIANPSRTAGQGAQLQFTITVDRTNFGGEISFSSSTLGTGNTISFNPASTTGNSTVMTVSIGVQAVPGSFTAFVNASGNGVQTLTGAQYQVTVTGESISLQLSQTGLLVIPGGASASSTLTIVRNGGFAGAVNLSAEGAPGGVSVTPNPASVPGGATTSTLTVSATGAAPIGLHNVTIRATPVNPAPPAAPGNGNPRFANPETISLAVTVQAPQPVLASVDFSGCAAADKPVWAAGQNGGFAFQRRTAVNDVYSWDVSNGRGSFAWVTQGAGGATTVMVQSMTSDEWTAGGAKRFCAAVGPRTVTGTLAGLGANDIARVSLGEAGTTATTALPGFTLIGVSASLHDLVVYSTPGAMPALFDRMALVRDVPAAATSAGSINLTTSPDAFTPDNAQVTLTGDFAGGESYFHSMLYLTGAACSPATLYSGMPVTGTSFFAYGAPLGRQRGGDRHGLLVAAAVGSTGLRTVTEYYHDFGARQLMLPTRLFAIGASALGGTPYKRLSVGLHLPADLSNSFGLRYGAGATTFNWIATAAWNGGPQNFILTTPDFTLADGWNSAWMPPDGPAVPWTVTATGTSLTGTPCGQAAGRLATSSFSGTA